MHEKSYGSVKVFESDVASVQKALSSYTEELSRRKEVLGVWLIGSYHRQDFTPFSDADVVIVVKSSEKRFIDRYSEYAPDALSVPLDIFVYTIEEVEEMRRSGHSFWKEIEQNHTTLFQRDNF